MFSMLHAENREEWPTGVEDEARISEGGENHEEYMYMYNFYSLGYSREGNSLQISSRNVVTNCTNM